LIIQGFVPGLYAVVKEGIRPLAAEANGIEIFDFILGNGFENEAIVNEHCGHNF
jgi:hypothetical protein